jgi:glycosyltransferase involved in cell wall biosynthesis
MKSINKSNQLPKVSIGIPAYNRPTGLKIAIQSVINQTYKNLEIIIADDASPVCDLKEMMESYGISDRRIKYFRHTKNIGSEKNFKFVLSKSTGKYFAWLADDDSVERDFVSKLITLFKADKKIVLSMCDIFIYKKNPSSKMLVKLESIRSHIAWPEARNFFFIYPSKNLFFCIYGLYRTSILKKTNFRITSLISKYDTGWEFPFLAKIASKGRIVSIRHPLKNYFYNEDSIFHLESRGMSFFMYCILQIELIFRTSFVAFSSSLPLAEKLKLFLKTWISVINFLLRKIF